MPIEICLLRPLIARLSFCVKKLHFKIFFTHILRLLNEFLPWFWFRSPLVIKVFKVCLVDMNPDSAIFPEKKILILTLPRKVKHSSYGYNK